MQMNQNSLYIHHWWSMLVEPLWKTIWPCLLKVSTLPWPNNATRRYAPGRNAHRWPLKFTPRKVHSSASRGNPQVEPPNARQPKSR